MEKRYSGRRRRHLRWLWLLMIPVLAAGYTLWRFGPQRSYTARQLGLTDLQSPNDADGDKLTVTEKLDGVLKKTRTNVTSGTQLTFECASTAAEFQKILNGTHTITIEVSDGKASATFTATFTKAVHKATITLKTKDGKGSSTVRVFQSRY